MALTEKSIGISVIYNDSCRFLSIFQKHPKHPRNLKMGELPRNIHKVCTLRSVPFRPTHPTCTLSEQEKYTFYKGSTLLAFPIHPPSERTYFMDPSQLQLVNVSHPVIWVLAMIRSDLQYSDLPSNRGPRILIFRFFLIVTSTQVSIQVFC